MQVFFLPEAWSIALCFILWPLFQVCAALLCLRMPDECFSSFSLLFRARTWERGGQMYIQVFSVHKWKRFLPDGAAITKSGYKKKTLKSFSKPNLEKFLLESCRAELTHWLAILPFWVFGFFAPARTILYMLVYALAVNVPCIIAQRYNRPRILQLLQRLK